ncbi:hypothetical protein M8I34_14280 [Streptomyces sp. MCA2]|uniref:hypothetical protein n=1 Tax=Streptomyces sp. MCA2 TaxID=2944805 RepID=UPI0020228FDA|nr:hypothetical protein [Streptomyces sp. MCA2]MCL7492593.1 hypothetical protein [Streptomyces sp. MCA2]
MSGVAASMRVIQAEARDRAVPLSGSSSARFGTVTAMGVFVITAQQVARELPAQSGESSGCALRVGQAQVLPRGMPGLAPGRADGEHSGQLASLSVRASSTSF